MKKTIFVFVLMLALAGTALTQGPGGGGQRGERGRGGPPPAPPATGPIADMVNAIVDAYNKKDTAFFDKIVAMDALWLDEDGHMIPARRFLTPQLNATPARKLSITNLRVAMIGEDAGWAGFNYVIDDGVAQRKGTDSIVFKKTGGEWQAALIHGAVNAPAVPH